MAPFPTDSWQWSLNWCFSMVGEISMGEKKNSGWLILDSLSDHLILEEWMAIQDQPGASLEEWKENCPHFRGRWGCSGCSYNQPGCPSQTGCGDTDSACLIKLKIINLKTKGSFSCSCQKYPYFCGGKCANVKTLVSHNKDIDVPSGTLPSESGCLPSPKVGSAQRSGHRCCMCGGAPRPVGNWLLCFSKGMGCHVNYKTMWNEDWPASA